MAESDLTVTRAHRLLSWYDRLSRQQQNAAILALSGLLLFLATPRNLLHGFLMAEEGTTYLHYARAVPPLRALFAPHQQYLSLYPNLVTLIGARYVPLQWAALLAAWAATLVHLLSVLLIAQCERFTVARMRLLAAILTLFVGGMSTAIDSTIQSQFAFGICSLAVLLSDANRFRVLRTAVLVIGGLNGTLSCFLVPCFWYRAWRLRDRTASLQAALLTACSALQLFILHAALPFSTRQAISPRHLWEYIDVLSTHLLLLPFLTRLTYHAVAVHLSRMPVLAWIALAFATLLGFVLLFRVVRKGGRLAQALIAIALLHACASLIGMEGTSGSILGGGDRYFVVANTAIALALVLRLQKGDSRSSTWLWARGLVLLLVISSLLDFTYEWRPNQGGPQWAPQIAAWRRNPSTSLHVGPPVWAARKFYLPASPTSIDMPYYTFDSNTRPEVLQRLPSAWFTPDSALPSGPDLK